MKNFNYLLKIKNVLPVFIILLISCTPNDNDPTTNEIIPLAPTNLNGNNTENSIIKLSWTDNSTNEIGFIIERKTPETNYEKIGDTGENVTVFSDTNLINNTQYSYRVYSYNSAGNSITYSNEYTTKAIGLPTLSTTQITIIKYSSITSGGEITNDGGMTVTERGIVWDVNPNPTISLTTKTSDGKGTGFFTSQVNNLSPDKTYYLRSYATNYRGTAYGNEISFNTPTIYTNGAGVIDICGNNYPSIKINGVEWMQKNLNVCKYRNGDIIPQISNLNEWSTTTKGAWCYYNFDPTNEVNYGKLYNWYAVNDPRGLAPTGWHVSTKNDWISLKDYLEGWELAGGRIKSTGTTYWNSPNTGANNESGFSALPGGTIYGWGSDLGFYNINSSAYWWYIPFEQQGFVCYYNSNNLLMDDNISENSGLSVRCVKD